jgi:hypothetical protein
VSDADPLKPYSVALVMIVDPRFSAIVSTESDVCRACVGELAEEHAKEAKQAQRLRQDGPREECEHR